MIACLAEIEHKLQAYDTVGNWAISPDGQITITVSKMADDYMYLVAVHELIEAYLCKKNRISEASVTDWDLEFEARRPEGNFSEPGDDPRAPYHHEHVFATIIEKMVAEALGVDWEDYDRTVREL